MQSSDCQHRVPLPAPPTTISRAASRSFLNPHAHTHTQPTACVSHLSLCVCGHVYCCCCSVVRVVHGLDIHSAVQLTDATISKIKQASVLAPLHNPPGLQGIEAAMKVFGGVPQVTQHDEGDEGAGCLVVVWWWQ